MSTIELAVFQLVNRQKRVIAEFRAEKGPDGNGVVHLLATGGERVLRNRGFTPVSAGCADASIVEAAFWCAKNHLAAYHLKASIVRLWR